MAGFRARTTDLVDLQVVPYPAATLVIDFTDGIHVEDARGHEARGSIVAGLAPGMVRGRGRSIDCLQLRLSPVLAHAVFGASSEIGETVVSLNDLWGRDAVRMLEQLRSARTWNERFATAEAALLRRCQAGRQVDPEVAFVWQMLLASRGQTRVEHLADEVGWSRKRLWSRYRSQIGITPKRAAQLIRFDHAAHRLAAGDAVALVAAESGYADQSHLHRACTAFAGVTPTALAAAPWLAVDDIAWAAR
jgi:methylphosphotriester-DNA--protein-cysteine methyltransferase